jgi:hypothetical protein
MPAKSDPRETSAAGHYYYRRSLGGRELLPAIGAGIAIGLAAFYLTRLVMERTPLTAEGLEPRRRKHGHQHGHQHGHPRGHSSRARGT